jgi:polysaccharide export outer membrane protein
MTSLLKILAAALAAALASGCGASSINELPGSTTHLASSTASSQSAGPAADAPKLTPVSNSADARPAGDAHQQEALKKVAQFTAVADPSSKAYKVGPRDVLEITVFKVPDLSKTVQVSEGGTINYPLAGEIMAGNKTAREIELELTRILGSKYLQNPAITVFIKEHNSQRVTVEGNVAKPGVVPMAGGMTLLQAIAQAGGLGGTAEKTAIVFRMVDGRRLPAKYDVSDIRSGTAEDPQLQSCDVIIVPTSDMREGVDYVVKFLPLAAIAPLL